MNNIIGNSRLVCSCPSCCIYRDCQLKSSRSLHAIAAPPASGHQLCPEHLSRSFLSYPGSEACCAQSCPQTTAFCLGHQIRCRSASRHHNSACGNLPSQPCSMANRPYIADTDSISSSPPSSSSSLPRSRETKLRLSPDRLTGELGDPSIPKVP